MYMDQRYTYISFIYIYLYLAKSAAIEPAVDRNLATMQQVCSKASKKFGNVAFKKFGNIAIAFKLLFLEPEEFLTLVQQLRNSYTRHQQIFLYRACASRAASIKKLILMLAACINHCLWQKSTMTIWVNSSSYYCLIPYTIYHVCRYVCQVGIFSYLGMLLASLLAPQLSPVGVAVVCLPQHPTTALEFLITFSSSLLVYRCVQLCVCECVCVLD